MFTALPLAIADLADRRILSILVKSLLITLLIFAAIGVALGWALAGADPCSWFGDGECALDASASGIGAVALTLLALWFLFPAVAIGVVCGFIEPIMKAIEARHYPGAAASARSPGIGGYALLGLRSALRVLIYNLLALPLYIILLFTGIGPIIAFVVVNGIAFGRDLGEMVATRHADRAARLVWLDATRGSRMLIGSMVTGLFLVPFANLLAPVLGAAMTAHLFHRSRLSASSSPR